VRPRGLGLAREKGWSLAWDEKDRLHLLNRTGALQAQKRLSGALVAACCADDGSTHAAVGSRGEVWLLAPDLTPRWQEQLPHRPVALALDPFGQYLAVADDRSHLRLFDRNARTVFMAQTPRPLHHLTFVPAVPRLLGSSDFGLVACYDLAGDCLWRDGLVSHVGALTVSGAGEQIVLACFTEGLQRYQLDGQNKGRIHVADACRLAALSFDGRSMLVTGLDNRLLLLDAQGRLLCDYLLGAPAVAICLGPLGEYAVVALVHDQIVGLDLREVKPG
jgi:hypothetical protein